MKTSRRKFLSQAACGSCMMIAGSSMLFLESCSSSSGAVVYDTPTFSMPKSEFASVNNVIVKHKSVGNILVRKIDDTNYTALSLKCPHAGGKVSPNNGGLKCSLHGSTFDMTGKRLAGKAQQDLPAYSAAPDGDNIVIKVG